MKKLFQIIILGFFYFFILFLSPSYANLGGNQADACDQTISSATTDQLTCNDDDSLTVDSNGSITFNNQNAVNATQKEDVTISNSGTIKVTTSGGSLDSPIQGQSSLNLNITNSGTIWAQDDYGIKLIEAEKVTITNEAGGIIKGTPASSGSQIAIGGTKMGNCDTCLNESTTSSGEGLTLHNYGTIDSDSRTVYGGHASGHTSKKTKIYNYDGGVIDATSSSAVKFQYAEDIEIYNYSGATIQTGTGNYAIDLKGAETITIDNAGDIKPGAAYGVFCDLCNNLTLTNSGNIEATSDSLFLRDMTGTNTITNSGTIKNTSGGRSIQFNGSTGVTLENTGTIESVTQVAVDFVDNVNPTLKNWGTIKTTANKSKVVDFPQTDATGTGGTVENYGTIIASTGSSGQAFRIGDGTATWNDLKIINSGTISSVGEAILVSGGQETTGLDITTKGDGTWVGEIDMNSAAVTMTLDCSISKDQDIEIEDKTNMVVVNNLCGNDTYEILDSSKNTDADNSETNGYLRIYGEELEVVSNNKKYRTEIFKNGLSQIYKSINDIKEQSVFFSISKRNNIYSNSISGVSGFFSNNDYEEGKLRAFLTYFEQNSKFNSKEKSKSENLAVGYKVDTEIENLTVTPLFGISSNKVTDIETESNEIKRNNFLGQFLAIHSDYKFNRKTRNNNELSIKISSEYGAHRLPKYITNFTHGDLSVDEAIDQVFSAGFDVEYSLNTSNGFVLKPYTGVSFNNTLSKDIEIYDVNGAGLKENISQGHVMNGVFAKKIGFSLTKNNDDFGLNLNLEHSNQDGLIDNNINFSISKKLQKIRKLRKKEEEKLDPQLEKLYDQLQVIKENERLKELTAYTLKENSVMKDLIIELIKENQKLKFENKIFKKKLN